MVEGTDFANTSINAYESEKAAYREALPRRDEALVPSIGRQLGAHHYIQGLVKWQ